MDQPSIVTHGDFDGLVSAAIVSLWSGIDFFVFAGPDSIRRLELAPEDVVCDLPHPMRSVRAWFDHHAGNIEEAAELNLDAGQGAAWEAPSAARVAFEHLKKEVAFPPFMEDTVRAGDRVDTMDYASVEEWLAETPENVINGTIFLPGEDLSAARPYMLWLTRTFREMSLEKIVEFPQVKERHLRSVEHAKRSREIVARSGEKIAEGRILLLDFSQMKVPPRFSRNYAYVVFPEIRAVLTVNPVFQAKRRTNDLRLSMAVNPFVGGEDTASPDVAAMFENMGIGGGHPSAAGGKITADSKAERLRKLKEVLAEITAVWSRD